jgi:hypothetical protein
MSRCAAVVLFALVVVASAYAQPAPGTGKKLIYFGWGYPSPQWLAENTAQADSLGFDGVCLDLPFKRGGKDYRLGWLGFGGPQATLADFKPHLDTLRGVQFERLKCNFLRMNTTPGDFDVFDRDFDTVIENFRVAALVVKEIGFVGILFDPEHYGKTPFHYQSRKYADQQSYEQYCAKYRERGAQVMRAINKSLPNVVILTTWANSIPVIQSKHGDLLRSQYNLLPAWYDGMVEAATEGTKIVDGYETSYGFKQRQQFLEAYHTMLGKGRALSAVPDAYRRRVTAGFGIWGDNGGKFDPTDFSKNYFTPEELEQSLRTAFEISDEYVWMYNHHIGWWSGKAPAEYLAAVRRAREPAAGPTTTGWLGSAGDRTLIDSAKGRTDYPESVTFGDLWKDYRDLGNLPESWLFKLDWKDEGLKQTWFAADLKTADWKPIKIGDWWEPQGIAYDGVAWYRLKWRVPANAPEKLWLAFGAVDEAAWVWIDGKLAGQHDVGDVGWNQRFLIPVTGLLKPDQEATIVVRVLDGDRYGGIWKPIKLITAK